MGKTHELFPHCFFSGMSPVTNGLVSRPHQNTKKNLIPSLHRNVDLLLSFIKLTNMIFCFVIVEEIASENSDSIYSSTPEVKA